MGKKVIIDTNIIISAFGWGGNPERIIRMAVSGEIEWHMSQDQMDEISRVIEYPKLQLSKELRSDMVETIRKLVVITSTETSPGLIDGPDDLILKPMLTEQIDFVITGDKEVLSLPFTVTPFDFLRIQAGQARKRPARH